MKRKGAGAARPAARKTSQTAKRKGAPSRTVTAESKTTRKKPAPTGKASHTPKHVTGQKPGGAQKRSKAVHPQVFYRIHALLHSMRAIESHEEQLCIIMTDIERSGTVNADLADELSDLLNEIPSFEYQRDLDAVREALAPSPPRGAAKAGNKARSSKRSGTGSRT